MSVLDQCIDKGVTERPPVAGKSYVAFAVHPPRPGPVALAIAHCESDTLVVDVVREAISIADAAALMQRYGIAAVTGAESEGDGFDLAHATLGALNVLRERRGDAMSATFDRGALERWRADPASFVEECLINPETGEPFVLLEAEKQFLKFAFTLLDSGKLKYSELIYSCPKKSGKTTFAAIFVIVLVMLFGERYSEAICCANDYEQAASRVHQAIKQIVEASPMLAAIARITADKVTLADATIRAIPSDYASAAGSNQNIAVFDELWGFGSERANRLFDELVPVPTRRIACRLTVTHAGFSGESVLLEELYKRGLQQPQIAPNLYAGDSLLMFWSHDPVAGWQDEAWIASMRRSLRPNQFLRMVENRFTTSEASFIDMAKWDACVHPALGHAVTDPALSLWCGVDASVKHDSTAIVGVTWDDKAQGVRLCFHRIWQPSDAEHLDFESTIEACLLELAKRFYVRKVLFDPYQMVSSAQRLSRAGLLIEEFPQSPPNLTMASQNLYELVMSGGILLYPDAAMRLAISRAVAVESVRGLRIAKEKQSHKIDVVVALAMAAHACVRDQTTPGYSLAAYDPNFVDRDRPSVPGSLPNRTEDLATALHTYIGLHKRWF